MGDYYMLCQHVRLKRKRKKKKRKRTRRLKEILHTGSSFLRAFCQPFRRTRAKLFFMLATCLTTTLFLAAGKAHTSRFSWDTRADRPWQLRNFWARVQLWGFGSDDGDGAPTSPKTFPNLVFRPDCESFFRGDRDEVQFTKLMLYKEARVEVTDAQVKQKLVKKCLNTHHGAYFSRPSLSNTTSNMSLAYMLTVSKNAEQVERMLQAIHHPDNVYCLIVSPSCTSAFLQAMTALGNCFPSSMQVVTTRSNTSSPRTNSTQPAAPPSLEVELASSELKCLHWLNRFHSWTYFLKISGQHYPLFTDQGIKSQIRSRLSQPPGHAGKLQPSNRSDWTKASQDTMVTGQRQSHDHNTNLSHISVVPSERASHTADEARGIDLAVGSPYFASSRQFISHVIQSPLTQQVVHNMNNVSQAESGNYWPTLVSVIRQRMADHSNIISFGDLFATEWSCSPELHHSSYHPCHSQNECILLTEHLQCLAKSTKFLFAHKFDLDIDHIAFKCLEERHRQISSQENVDHNHISKQLSSSRVKYNLEDDS